MFSYILPSITSFLYTVYVYWYVLLNFKHKEFSQKWYFRYISGLQNEVYDFQLRRFNIATQWFKGHFNFHPADMQVLCRVNGHFPRGHFPRTSFPADFSPDGHFPRGHFPRELFPRRTFPLRTFPPKFSKFPRIFKKQLSRIHQL
jgi:hypothetical protein